MCFTICVKNNILLKTKQAWMLDMSYNLQIIQVAFKNAYLGVMVLLISDS